MIALIENALSGYLPLTGEREENVIKAMRYSLLGGGKRIRAKLVLLFCEACGGDVDKALPFACAVEMVHAYSLIHDDLPCMDDDDLRRGKPSCHIEFDYATALLAGDALQSLAFETMASADLEGGIIAKAVKIFAELIGCHGMVGGQVIDIDYENKECNYDVLQDIERKKTGALIKASCVLGCLAADADEDKIKAAENYAEALGRAFQITDDILDITSTSEELGKPVGSDEDRNKSTFVSVMGMENAVKEVDRLTELAVNNARLFGEKGQKLINLAEEMRNRTK